MPLSEFIPRIRPLKKYFVWLDYDWALDPDMLGDIDGCMNQLSPKSIFLITIDARAKLPEDGFDLEQMPEQQRRRVVLGSYNEWFRPYLGRRVTQDDLDGKKVAALFYDTVMERIRESLTSRGLEFQQLFHFLYADGALMLTVGGMICGPGDAQRLHERHVFANEFVRNSHEHLWISVPPLTIREKQWLDKNMRASLTLSALAFELGDEELLENYRKFYKQYPTYIETIL